jgi:crossover junction endodeoxyribonuclease RuvC
MSLVIGVDPGKKGALALLDSYGELLEVDDMVCVGKWISAGLLAETIKGWTEERGVPIEATLVLEDVYSSPQMGVASAFSFGRAKGLVEMAATMADCRLEYVTPAKWKRDMKLGKDKGEAREMAANRWPARRGWFSRVKDDGRAEAALIALWQVRHGQA